MPLMNLAMAQPMPGGGPPDEAAALLGCGCWLFFLGFMVFGFLINILLCVWMYRDATRRDMDAPVVWVLIGLLFPILGLIIYLIVRPSRPY